MKPLSVTPWNTEGNFSHDSKECPSDYPSPRNALNVPPVDEEAQKDSRPKKERRKSAVRNQRRIGPLRGRLGNFQIVTSTGSIKRAWTRLGNDLAFSFGQPAAARRERQAAASEDLTLMKTARFLAGWAAYSAKGADRLGRLRQSFAV